MIAISGDALILLVAPAIVLTATWLGLTHAKLSFGLIDIVICGILLTMLYDLGDFVAHFLMHKIPFLWEMHKVHHSATFLSPITAFRAYPLEPHLYLVVHSLTVAPAAAAITLIYDVSLLDVLLLMWAAKMIISLLILQVLQHSHVPISFGILDYLVMSPHMHQLHHSTELEHWNKNMGVIFSLWDWLVGTAIRQDTRIPVHYGLGGGPEADAEYLSVYGVYIRPIVNMTRMVTGSPTNQTPGRPRSSFTTEAETAFTFDGTRKARLRNTTLGADYASAQISAGIARSRNMEDPT
jgi:sterol desaturase/sphingolipid hydroxylase (fatty acid hydroxylase superfamily)